MPELYPLRFQPIFRHYMWGGRRLGDLLSKQIGHRDDYAESWEIVDRGPDQSRVLFGPLRGQTLHELVQQHAEALLGRHAPVERFPLLLKFLDAQQNLSVQVHPTDQQAQALDPPDLGKTEAWVIRAAEPGSKIYAGLKRGFDRHALQREVTRGTTHLCLHTLEPRPGDCIFLPAGTLHAVGAGLLVAEIQQASDTTFRLFDWNRLDPDGQPRPLHIHQALDTINYELGPVQPQIPQPADRPHAEQLVSCDKFVLDRWRFTGKEFLGGSDRFHLLAVVAGEVQVAGDPSGQLLRAGETMLLPASVASVEVESTGETMILDGYLP